MRRTRLKCLYYYSIACVLWLAMHAGVLRAQNPADSTTPDTWPFQYDFFQLLLEQQGMTSASSLEQAFNQPKESVIVIAGNPPQWRGRSLTRLSEFVQRGGALLLATDNTWPVRGIAQFSSGPVMSKDPESHYPGFADCVIVKAVASDEPQMAGIARLVTNRSGWLRLAPNSPYRWDVVATFSETCLPEASRGQPLLAIGHSRQDDAGVIVLAADASLFTNGMLWHGDNAMLAIRLSRLLSGSGRTRLAFWNDGQLLGSARKRIESEVLGNQRDQRAAPPLPEPDLQKALKLANAVATEVGRSNVLNEALKQRPRHRPPAQYFRLLLIMAAVAAFLAAAWILLTNGTGRMLRPLAAGGRKVAKWKQAGQRASAATEVSDYRTPAGYLAREFCWELTGSRHSADWQKYLARQLVFEPMLSPPDQRDLAKIVDIASRGCREQMTTSGFEQLGKTIAALRAKQAAAKPAENNPSAVER